MDEAAKAGLRQIDEEGSTTELPLSTTHLHDAENNEEKAQEELKRELNFSELWGKHYWRQFTSITPGLVLLFASGIQIYWAIFKIKYQALAAASEHPDDDATMKILCWYFGAMIGSIVGIYLVTALSKQKIYYLGGGLLILSSAFFIASMLYAGRVIAGLNHGLIHLVVIVHASDNTSKRSRGAILRSISYIMTFSLLIVIVTCTPFSSYRQTTVGMGVYSVGYAMFALILTSIATNESIPFLIVQNQEALALHKYVKLRSERVPTPQTKKGFDIIHDTTLEDLKSSVNIFQKENRRPLALITAARLLSLCMTNIPILMLMSQNVLTEMRSHFQNLELNILLVYIQIARIILGFLPMFFATPFYRIRLVYILSVITGITIFLLIIPQIINTHTTIQAFWSAIAILCYLFTSLGADAIQYVQAAEAFPLTKKQYSFAFIAIIEHLCHIILFILYFNNYTIALILCCSVPIIVISSLLFKMMPISSALSIRDARLRYRAIS